MGPAELLLRHVFTYCLLLPTTLQKAKYWHSIYNAILAPCPDPGVPGNGNRSGDDFRHAKSVTFSCKEDYVLKGNATISCDNGDWTSKTPFCKGMHIYKANGCACCVGAIEHLGEFETVMQALDYASGLRNFREIS